MLKLNNKYKNNKVQIDLSVDVLIKSSQSIQQTITCSRSTIGKLDKGVKYIQS